ncbi:hypothetical protein lerEdw1_018369 [Lerista edwardsae]|nr:hypothetical protein lerEdw1_018369 [Lerista edwardsae]
MSSVQEDSLFSSALASCQKFSQYRKHFGRRLDLIYRHVSQDHAHSVSVAGGSQFAPISKQSSGGSVWLRGKAGYSRLWQASAAPCTDRGLLRRLPCPASFLGLPVGIVLGCGGLRTGRKLYSNAVGKTVRLNVPSTACVCCSPHSAKVIRAYFIPLVYAVRSRLFNQCVTFSSLQEIKRRIFPNSGEMYPRRGYDCWFPETGRLHEQFWHEGPHEQFWRDEPHPNWNQCHPEQQREHSQWKQDNYYNHDFPRNFESGGNYSVSVPYRGSYRRRPRGNFHQKSHHRGRFNKRPKSSFSKGWSWESGDFGRSSRSSTLINVTTDKKESDSVKAEAPSAAPKETEPDQTESAALAKQSNSFQVATGECLTAWQEMVRTKASKVVISASDFNFRLPHDSLALPQSKQELPLKKPEEIKVVEPVTACPKAEDGHRQAPCVLAVPLSSSVTLENLRPLKEEKNIEVVQIEILSLVLPGG